MNEIHTMNISELDGVNAFILKEVSKYSTRFMAAIEGKSFTPEEYAGVADFCRHGMRDTYLKPVLDGVVLSLAKFCNPDITNGDFTKLEILVRGADVNEIT